MTIFSIGKQSCARAFIWLLFVSISFLTGSCTRVQISDDYRGVVADAESGAPLSGVTIRVLVMRVSSYDGTSAFRKYDYKTNERGEFVLPAHKKIVESMTEKVEEIHYYEVIVFGKKGYQPQEHHTDEDSPFSRTDAAREKILIRLKRAEPATTR